MAETKNHPPVPYERHVFVCTTGSTCPTRGSEEVIDRLKRRVKEAGLSGRVRVNRSGCLDQCSFGPMLVVYPEAIWYGGVTPADVDEIFEQTIVRGERVARLLHPSESGGAAGR